MHIRVVVPSREGAHSDKRAHTRAKTLLFDMAPKGCQRRTSDEQSIRGAVSCDETKVVLLV